MKQPEVMVLNSEPTSVESFRMWIKLQLARILNHVNKNVTPVRWGQGN
jgi:hypothetical protein